MNNFLVRSLLLIFFELMLCAFINISSMSGSSLPQWIVSFVIILAGGGCLLILMSLFFCNGPYIRGTYAPGTFFESFWGVRKLHEDVIDIDE